MIELIGDLESVEPYAIPLAVQRRLSARYPERVISHISDSHFHVGSWAAGTRAGVVEVPSAAAALTTIHGSKGDVRWHTSQGHERVTWNGATFDVFSISIPNAHGADPHAWVAGPSDELNRALFGEVVDWNANVHGEVLVFSAGCFSKDRELQESINATRFEDLVLPDALVKSLRDDVRAFLSSKALYAEAGATWKRGMLLMGPPGNGKTHAIKALIKQTGLPCVYVQSFSGRYVNPAQSIPKVFERARELAPCVLVLEDLDSLVDDENRSFLLNEMDGFALNDGLITIASTNHPERLDPSLLHRPSRFDRKYRFELPDLELRTRYLEAWAKRFAGVLDPAALARVAELSEGFTFAYLKELGLSTQMQWASDGKSRPLDEVLVGVVEGLKQEILATPNGPPPPKPQMPRMPWQF